MAYIEHPEEFVQFVNIEDADRTSPGEGITVRELPATDSASSWVLDFAPGSQWGEVDHHEGEEHYYVLSGEIIDGQRRHRAGDYVVMAAGTSHQPHTESGASLLVISLRR